MIPWALVLAAVSPLPDAKDPRSGQLATQCVFLYRLQPQDRPTGAAACDEAGYGLDFMRARWTEIAALEAARKAQLQATIEEATLTQAALARRRELEPLCQALAFGEGPGPEGGEKTCTRADLPLVHFTRIRARQESQARAAAEKRQRAAFFQGVGTLGALAVGGLAMWALRRARRRYMD